MATNYSPTIVTDGAVFVGDALMPSTATSATKLYDRVGGNNGTMYNGTSLNFDNTDDYITINGFADNDPGTDSAWAVTFWARGDTASAGVNNDMIFSGHTASGGNIIRIGYDRANGGIFYSDDNTTDKYAGTTFYNDNTWHHVVITRPSGSGAQTTDVYVDGAKITGGTFSTSDPTWASATQFSIGQEYDSGTPGDYFDGNLADIRVYNVKLSAAQVTELYNDSKVVVPSNVSLTNLLGWWSLCEGAGSIAYDGSGNGNHGTLINSPGWGTGNTGAPQLIQGYNRPMLFPGATTEYVAVGNSSEFCFGTSSFSFGAWINSTDTSNYQAIFDAIHPANKGWQILTKTTAGMRVWLSTGSSSHNWDTSTQVCDGDWHHVGFTYNSSSQVAIIYVDGSADATSSALGAMDMVGGTYASSIGFQTASSNYPFDGLINEVVLYNTLLSSSQMAVLATTGPNDGPLPPDPTSGLSSLPSVSSLKGYWRNDGNITWTDRSGEGNNGTVAGSPSALLFKEGYNGNKNVNTGRDNQGFPLLYQNNGAIGFDGVKDYVNITPALDWNDFPSVTVSIWIQTNFTGATNYAFFSWGNSSNSGGLNMSINSSGYFYVSYRDNAWSTGSYPTLTSTTTVNDNKWHQCVFTYGLNPTIYVDGVVNGTASRNSAMTNISNELTYIGHLANHSIGNYHFDGRVANLQIYNRALRYGEIQQNYNAQKSRFT